MAGSHIRKMRLPEMNRLRHTVTAISQGIAVIASLTAMVMLTIYAGYQHDPTETLLIRRVLYVMQIAMGGNVIVGLCLGGRKANSGKHWVRWTVNIAILITLPVIVYPRPYAPWFPWLTDLLYSNLFQFAIIAAYSVVTLSDALMKIFNRRTNPSMMLSLSFLVIIIIGSVLLTLPKCTYHGISYADALFVSTSAVCITGLTPVDISLTFTPMGHLIIAILVQIGALGLMTFTSFFALFFSGSSSIYNQLMLKDVIYSRSMSALIPTLLYILGVTLVIELTGALLIYLSIHGTLGMSTAGDINFALFHSVSSFCNAGFSTLPQGLSNPLLLYGNLSIYWIMSALIILGSIGFPILVNYKDALIIRINNALDRLRHRPSGTDRIIHIYNANTKIVIITFTLLFVIGTVLFYILERDNSLQGMDEAQCITQSVFNSVTPRSAGFSSVDPAGFMNVTLVLVMFLMWVGGASQSTGGGIKVNTLAAICLNLRAIIMGRRNVTAFRRCISIDSIRRANAVVALSILTYLFFSVTLLWLEPDISTRSLLFESCSALFTVGSSLGATSELSNPSLILLCVAMFIGRVGIVSLLIGLVGRRHDPPVSYPTDNIIIT